MAAIVSFDPTRSDGPQIVEHPVYHSDNPRVDRPYDSDWKKPSLNMSIPMLIADHAPARIEEISIKLRKLDEQITELEKEKRILDELLKVVQSSR